MSVDLLSETRISLNELAREQNVALSTCWRWCLRGIKGHTLESIAIGGRKFTTREAFARFIAATNGESVPHRSSQQRSREQREARKQLVKSGLLTG
jgi:hypothetical protein